MRRGTFSLGHRGVSILEVLIAIIIIGAALGASSIILQGGDRALSRRSQRAELARLVQNDAELLRYALLTGHTPSHDSVYTIHSNTMVYRIIRTMATAKKFETALATIDTIGIDITAIRTGADSLFFSTHTVLPRSLP